MLRGRSTVHDGKVHGHESGRHEPRTTALLVLEDGRVYRGEAFGAAGARSARRCSPPG